jgi:cell division septation protein DedD
VRILKKLRELLRKRKVRQKAAPPVRAAGNDSDAPKNGRLTLAVIGVLLVMLVLAALNVRLILDPSIAGKAFGPWVPAKPDTGPETTVSQSCPATQTKSNASPPQVTFYSKLVAQEEQPHCSEGVEPDKATTQEGHQAADAKHSPGHDANPGDKHAEKKAGNREPSEAKKEIHQAVVEESLPGPDSGTGTYMVQIGAFTNPGIAQQWATRWKSRGYEVILKPVARPRTGILYRLYLGKFSSQQEADALVRRLKTREGISAFRLLVRN